MLNFGNTNTGYIVKRENKMTKNIYHQELVMALKKADPQGPVGGLFMAHYCGSDKPAYNLNTADHTKIIKEFVDRHDFTPQAAVDLIGSLYINGQSMNEIFFAGNLVGRLFNRDFDPQHLDSWLNYVHGWAEADVLCQSNFTDQALLGNWPAWEKILTKFVTDSNVHKRRASLVLLTKPLRLSPDPRLLKMAIRHVDLLKGERDILITKAISWALRSLVFQHPEVLAEYLTKNQKSLPSIAYREAYSKLTTGRKYNHQKKQKAIV
ncbi:DNA alkylation repair protein [Patescibacteria group bacterium]|nr:DNA alkylation repair protein [Patescibacteria group bacterium]